MVLATDTVTPQRSLREMHEGVRYYLIVDCESGLLDAMRNGERAVFASDATRNAERPAEHDRTINLAAVDDIFVIGIV